MSDHLQKLKQLAQEYAALIDAGAVPSSDRAAIGKGAVSVTTRASQLWGISTRSVGYRLADIKAHGLMQPIEEATLRYYQSFKKPEVDEAPQLGALEEHRLQREVKRLRAEKGELLTQLAAQSDLSLALEGVAEPLEPVSFQMRSGGKQQGETIILVLSDLQWGEVIDLAAMDGLNCYDPEIARARLHRLFSGWAELATKHWAGPPPERILLLLLGDMISGEIHEELAKTNGLLSIPALRDCAAHICAGIRLLREVVGVPIDILSVPGNHGRTTRKPESKLYAAHSYDTLLADIVELEFREAGQLPEWLTMWKPASGDALVWVYGYRFLFTHGDRIGSRGGAGFVGTAATVARGFKKLVMDYAGRGVVLDFIICAHFHTALQLEEGICNGCLPGPSEYSRDLRFRPRPAVQAFLTVHPRHGVTQIRWLNVGSPEEGDLYAEKLAPANPINLFGIPHIGI